MKTYDVTIHYIDTDGKMKYCSIIRTAKSEEEAKQYAIGFFFNKNERQMIQSVETREC